MTDRSDSEIRSRMPRWLKVVFTLSLAGNLAVIGIVAGAALRGDNPHKSRRMMQPPPAAAAIGGAMFRSLDWSQRRALRALANGPYDSVYDRRRAELGALLDVIRAEPLDLDTLETELAAQQAGADAVRAQLQSVWVAKLAQMSPSERQAVADRIQAHVARLGKPGQYGRDRLAKPTPEAR